MERLNHSLNRQNKDEEEEEEEKKDQHLTRMAAERLVKISREEGL